MMSYYTRGYGSISNLNWNPEDSISNLSDFADSISREEADQNEWKEKQERIAIKRAEAAAKKGREQEEAKQQEKLLQEQKSEEIRKAKAEEDAHLAALDDGTDIPPWHREQAKNNKPDWLLELLVKVAEKEDADDMYLIYKRPQQLPARQELSGIKQAALEEAQNENRIYKTPYALPPKKEAQVVAQATKEELIEYIEEEIIIVDDEEEEHVEEIIEDDEEEILVDDAIIEEEVLDGHDDGMVEEEVWDDNDGDTVEEIIEDEEDEDEHFHEEIVEDTAELKELPSSDHIRSPALTTGNDASVVEEKPTPFQTTLAPLKTQKLSTPWNDAGAAAPAVNLLKPKSDSGLLPTSTTSKVPSPRPIDAPTYEAPWKTRNLKKAVPADKESNDDGDDDDDPSYQVPWKNVPLKARFQPEELKGSKVQEKLKHRSPILKPAFVVTKEQLKSSKPQEKLSHKPPLPKRSKTPTKGELESSMVQQKLRNKSIIHKPSFEVSKKELECNVVREKLSNKPNIGPLLNKKASLTPTKYELQSSKVQQKLRTKAILRKPSFEVSKRDLECNVVKDKLSKKTDISNMHALAKGEEMASIKKKLKHRNPINLKGPSDLITSTVNTINSHKEKPIWMQRTLELQRSSRDLGASSHSTTIYEPTEEAKERPQWMRALSRRQSSGRLDDQDETEKQPLSHALPWKDSPRRLLNDQDQEEKETTTYALPWKESELKSSVVQKKPQNRLDISRTMVTASTNDLILTKGSLEDSPKAKPAWMLRTLELQQSLSNLAFDNDDDNNNDKSEVPWANYKLKPSSKSS
jgi:hypothetical protein